MKLLDTVNMLFHWDNNTTETGICAFDFVGEMEWNMRNGYLMVQVGTSIHVLDRPDPLLTKLPLDTSNIPDYPPSSSACMQ